MVGVLCSNHAHAQPTWRKAFGAYGQDEAGSVVVTTEGDIILAGSTGSFGNGSSDAYLLKVSGEGDLLWSAAIGGPQIDHAEGLVLLPDGNVVFAGFSNGGDHGGYDGWLVKANEVGQVVWSRYFGGSDWDLLHDIDMASNGGFYLTGSTYSEGAGASDGWVIRVDTEGEPVWIKVIGGAFDDVFYSGDATSDGGVIVAGATSSDGLDMDGYICKLNASGGVEWENVLATDSVEYVSDVLQIADGRFSVVGTTRYWENFNEYLHVMYSPGGSVQWTKHWGQVNDQEATAQLQVPSGKLYTVGYTETTGAGAKDVFIFRCDPDVGDYEDQDSFGGTNDDVGYAVAQVPDGFILVGKTNSFGAGGDDVLIIRTDTACGPAVQAFGEVFDPVTIAEAGPSNGMLLYPNPASEVTRLRSAASLSSAHLLDPQGRLVRSWSAPVPVDLDLRGLCDGAYRLVTVTGDRIRASQALIIAGN